MNEGSVASASTWASVALLIGGAAVTVGVGGGMQFAVGVLTGFLASLFVHELGHVVAARACGLPVRRFTVHLLGGSVEYALTPPARTRAAVSMGGPAASALSALPALVLGAGTDGVDAVLGGLVAGSAVLMIVNLLPLPGSDGWHAASALRDR